MLLSRRPRGIAPALPSYVLGACLFAFSAIAGDLGGVDADGRYEVVHPITDARPIARITPGAIDSAVTQTNIHSTICVRGYTKQVRPPAKYTGDIKRTQIGQYAYQDRRLRDYEEDHLIPLELGGSPTSAKNLWPEPRHVVGG